MVGAEIVRTSNNDFFVSCVRVDSVLISFFFFQAEDGIRDRFT